MVWRDSRVARPQPAPEAPQLRGWVARSNSFLVAQLPPGWVFALAWPHEIWHYLVARWLGLRARLVPAATLFEPAPRWKTALVLAAPATLGLTWPLLWLGAWQWLRGDLAAIHWGMLALLALAWWSGCAGDVMDLWLLVAGRESGEQRLARMQPVAERYRLD